MDPDGLFLHSVRIAAKHEKKFAVNGIREVASRSSVRLDSGRELAIVPVVTFQGVQGARQIVVETIEFACPERILENIEMVEERAGGM
jgi:hypothetical protein